MFVAQSYYYDPPWTGIGDWILIAIWSGHYKDLGTLSGHFDGLQVNKSECELFRVILKDVNMQNN